MTNRKSQAVVVVVVGVVGVVAAAVLHNNPILGPSIAQQKYCYFGLVGL